MKFQEVDEETISIDLSESCGLKIKGILRGSFDWPMVVMVHGLPGEGNELLQYLGARYLFEQGFSSLRLFLYSDEEKTRNLADCTVQIHADDFDEVIKYLRTRTSSKIFATGHSYGGLTILRAKSKLDGAVLWDPTHGLVFQTEFCQNLIKSSVDTGDFRLYLDGAGYIEPKAITEEQLALGDNSREAAGKDYPLKFISAGQGIMSEFHKKYLAVADSPKAHHVINGAHHPFDDSDKVLQELFAETAAWLEKFV